MFAGLLIHRVQIKRPSGNLDRFKQPSPFPYNLDGAEYACRLTTAGGRGETNTERSREVYNVSHVLFVEPGADIREDDWVRVYDPIDGYEMVKNGNISLIKRVFALGSLHHIECKIDVVRGPNAA